MIARLYSNENLPIPPVSHFRVPLLQILGDGKERTLAEAALDWFGELGLQLRDVGRGLRLTPQPSVLRTFFYSPNMANYVDFSHQVATNDEI